jgi:hypothetical protein
VGLVMSYRYNCPSYVSLVIYTHDSYVPTKAQLSIPFSKLMFSVASTAFDSFMAVKLIFTFMHGEFLVQVQVFTLIINFTKSKYLK